MICARNNSTSPYHVVGSIIQASADKRNAPSDELVSWALVRAQLDVHTMTVAEWRELVSSAYALARSVLGEPVTLGPNERSVIDKPVEKVVAHHMPTTNEALTAEQQPRSHGEHRVQVITQAANGTA